MARILPTSDLEVLCSVFIYMKGNEHANVRRLMPWSLGNSASKRRVNRCGKREAILLWMIFNHLQGRQSSTLVRREPDLGDP